MSPGEEAPGGVHDVAVVGGGIAGMVAAVRCAELGLRVLVLEKGEDERYCCNSRFTGGAFHISFHEIHEPAQSLEAAIRDVTGGFARPGLAAAISTDARLAVAWLKQQGVRFIKAGPDAWRQNFLAPPGLMKPGLNWQGRGGDVMLRTLRARLESLGGRLLLGALAQQLVMRDGVCTGIEIERHGLRRVVPSHNVVLCDGGFQANMRLMREHVSPAPEKLKQRGAATGQGDALCMAVAAGAATSGMDNVYGHLLCQQALADDRLWPYPILDSISGAGIVVDGQGRRFMDEGLGGVYMTNGIARLADPLSATAIFDRAIWEGPATDFILPANPNLVLAGGAIVAAETVEDLAQKLGLPADALRATVDRYNQAVESGAAPQLQPPRTSGSTRPWPIRQAPFLGVRLAAGVTYTMGGIAIDEHGQVLGTDGKPMPGLYASGSATGGLEGGARSGYVGGLTKAAVMSLRLATAIASRQAQERAAPVALAA